MFLSESGPLENITKSRPQIFWIRKLPSQDTFVKLNTNPEITLQEELKLHHLKHGQQDHALFIPNATHPCYFNIASPIEQGIY